MTKLLNENEILNATEDDFMWDDEVPAEIMIFSDEEVKEYEAELAAMGKLENDIEVINVREDNSKEALIVDSSAEDDMEFRTQILNQWKKLSKKTCPCCNDSSDIFVTKSRIYIGCKKCGLYMQDKANLKGKPVDTWLKGVRRLVIKWNTRKGAETPVANKNTNNNQSDNTVELSSPTSWLFLDEDKKD